MTRTSSSIHVLENKVRGAVPAGAVGRWCELGLKLEDKLAESDVPFPRNTSFHFFFSGGLGPRGLTQTDFSSNPDIG